MLGRTVEKARRQGAPSREFTPTERRVLPAFRDQAGCRTIDFDLRPVDGQGSYVISPCGSADRSSTVGTPRSRRSTRRRVDPRCRGRGPGPTASVQRAEVVEPRVVPGRQLPEHGRRRRLSVLQHELAGRCTRFRAGSDTEPYPASRRTTASWAELAVRSRPIQDGNTSFGFRWRRLC